MRRKTKGERKRRSPFVFRLCPGGDLIAGKKRNHLLPEASLTIPGFASGMAGLESSSTNSLT